VDLRLDVVEPTAGQEFGRQGSQPQVIEPELGLAPHLVVLGDLPIADVAQDRLQVLGDGASALAPSAPTPPSGCEPERIGQLARPASQLAPDDEDLAQAAVAGLVGMGHVAEADQLVRDTMSALTELGVDAEGFRRPVAALTP
jgi:hypothetical protein